MTRYTWDVTVPAGTPQSAAVVNTVEVDEAVIQDGLIFAPPGTAGLVFAEIRFGDLVLLPSANSSTVGVLLLPLMCHLQPCLTVVLAPQPSLWQCPA
jgi:hypothetical protein